MLRVQQVFLKLTKRYQTCLNVCLYLSAKKGLHGVASEPCAWPARRVVLAGE